MNIQINNNVAIVQMSLKEFARFASSMQFQTVQVDEWANRKHKKHKKHYLPKECQNCHKSYKGTRGLGIHQSKCKPAFQVETL